MKRLMAFLLAFITIFAVSSCEQKVSPELRIKVESIESIDFKKTYFKDDLSDPRDYKQKSVTDKDDIKEIVDWLVGLSITKHDAIEIPVERVNYVIMLNGKKTHKVIFMDNYIIYDSQAYTFDNKSDIDSVKNKYNLLGYTEIETDLDII